MGNRSESSYEQQDPWEKKISDLHGRLLDYLRQTGDFVHITDGDNEDVDSACCTYTFQILRDNNEVLEGENPISKVFSLSSEVYECVCEDGEDNHSIPDDIEVYLGFDEEVFLLVSPEIAVITDRNGSILRDAEEPDFCYFEDLLSAASTPPPLDTIPNPDGPMEFN